MTEDFEIEPMTCSHCGEEVSGCIMTWVRTHSCIEGTIQKVVEE